MFGHIFWRQHFRVYDMGNAFMLSKTMKKLNIIFDFWTPLTVVNKLLSILFRNVQQFCRQSLAFSRISRRRLTPTVFCRWDMFAFESVSFLRNSLRLPRIAWTRRKTRQKVWKCFSCVAVRRPLSIFLYTSRLHCETVNDSSSNSSTSICLFFHIKIQK